MGLDAAGVGADSGPSVEDSSMMLSRDARGFKCVRDRERGRRRLTCGGEGRGDAWGTTEIGEDGEERGDSSIILWDYGGGRG